MHCPNCQFQNATGVALCAQCGRPLVPALPQSTLNVTSRPSKARRTPKPPSPPIPLDICRVCGTNYPMNLSTCPLCFAPMGTVANPNDPTGDTFRYVGYPYRENANVEEDASQK